MYNRNKHSCGVDRALNFFVDDGNLYSFTHNQVLESPSKHISYSWEKPSVNSLIMRSKQRNHILPVNQIPSVSDERRKDILPD